MQHQLVFGTSAAMNSPPILSFPVINFPGKTLQGKSGFQINEDLMSRHILLLGGSGCGKTNVFCYTIDALRTTMRDEDIAIIFDTKGEFYDKFAHERDYVIGNGRRFQDISYTWNIFDEILADGWNNQNITLNAREMAAALFRDRGSTTQPFFCNAARDIFYGILIHFIRQALAAPEEWQNKLNNADLIHAFQSFQAQHYVQIFNHYPDLRSFVSYLGDGKSNQALGVLAELNSMLSEYFVGILAAHNLNRSISMRNAVRGKGSRVIFIEYDLSVGETLTPIYRLLMDQALKEALSRSEKAGNVYFIADEFKLLPKLQHIDDALNFGRGLGVRVMAGIQSIDQLYDVYGKERGAVVAGGFGSIFAFHTNDGSSRDYVTKRFGSNIVVYEYVSSQKNTIVAKEREGNTVEEWDQLKLGLGQAVIGLGHEPPFLFQFEKYRKQETQ